jgi:outer membrane protein TolC
MKHPRIHKQWSVVAAFLICCFYSQAQALEWANFRQQVLEYHPLAQQADLYRSQADFGLLRAKGGFDPKLYAEFYTKNFTEKTYFQYTEAGVKLPTWGGFELKSTYNLASGTYLNAESTLPSNGQATLGFNWTLVQGLLLDERRAALRQARIGLQTGDAERDMAINDLLFDAAKTYWTWVVADNQLRIYTSALRQSRIRHEALRESFFQGDKPAIDTIETFIQVQNRLLDVNFASVDAQNATLALNNFLWTTEGQTLALAQIPAAPTLSETETIPQNMLEREELAQQAQANHPELRLYRAKNQSLEVERRLKIEKRKPVLDLNYNLLGAGWTFFPTTNAGGIQVLANDIKWGVNFSYPIFNRKARGDWQLTQVKIAQTKLDIQQKSQVIDNKVRQYANDLDNLRNQVVLFRDITRNYLALLEAETEKFNQGESSIFLINTREQRWLDAQVKYLKLVAEYRKTEAALLWAAGRF